MISLEDIKTSIIKNSDWIQFATKQDDPFLSIFPPHINEGLSELTYINGKSYFFNDDTHDYKIRVSKDNLFTFFIRKTPKTSIPIKISTNKPKTIKTGIKLSPAMIILFGTILFILIECIFLIDIIKKVFWW